MLGRYRRFEAESGFVFKRAATFMAVLAALLLPCIGVQAAPCSRPTCGPSVAPLERYQAPTSAHIQEELRRIHQQAASVPQRVEAISELFLGAPYKLGPLGEGPDGEFDRDPLMRFDAFDCTTFVETVMALSLDSDLDAAKRTLQKIRYRDGQIGYATRNHFIELDWVPNNLAAGFIRDITADVAGRSVVKVSKKISKKKWYLRKSAASLEGEFAEDEKQQFVSKLRHLGEQFEDQRATLPVLPMTALPRLIDNMPSGTIVNLVHKDQGDRDSLVSHQGILIKKSDGWYLRAASIGKSVEDHPISNLDAYRDLKWRLIGFNLNVLQDPHLH